MIRDTSRFITNLKHGESPHAIRTKEYNVWRMMRQRCSRPTHKAYKWYGGKGIGVCKRWNDYSNFLADMGRCPHGYSLDRIDSKGDYSPKNCRWTDWITQENNRANNRFFSLNGKIQTVPQWARELGINKNTIWTRLRRGLSFKEAISNGRI